MKSILLVLMLLASTLTYAQQYVDRPSQKEDRIKSLLNNENEITGFGNLDFRLSNILDKQALVMGAYGGLIINRKIMLGLAGYGIASKIGFVGIIPNTATSQKLNMYGGYGGIVLGMMIASKEVIHLSFPIILAIGNIDISDDDYLNLLGSDKSYTLESSKFFVIEPTAQLELNISKSFRIGLGGGYRLVRALELENVTDADMSNFTGVLSFKFGGF